MRALLASVETLSFLPLGERIKHSETQPADASKVPMRSSFLAVSEQKVGRGLRKCCPASSERRTTTTNPNIQEKKPSPSQLVERLHGHAGPAGRRGTPGAGEQAQPDARGGVEAALAERGFGELRRRRRRRRVLRCRGRLRGQVELTSCCRCCSWQRRRRRRRARGRRRRRHEKRERKKREGGGSE